MERYDAVFLDRDGVIIEDSGYIGGIEDVVFIPGSIEAIRLLTEAGTPVFVATNQSGVGRGFYTKKDVEKIHELISEKVRLAGGRIEVFYCCPHLPGDNCKCRKPKPGMLTSAAQTHGLDLSRAVMIGDSARDLKCAINAGSVPVLVRTGNGREAEKAGIHAAVFDNLLDATCWVQAGRSER